MIETQKWKNMRQLILASASPRRVELLQAIGVRDFMVIPADVDEREKPKEQPQPYVRRLAREKAEKIASLHPGCFVLGADTTIAVGRRIFHKATSAAQAKAHISLLSGRRHWVYTGVCLITPQGKILEKIGKTHVKFKRLSAKEMDAFVDSEEWKGVCGYRSQGLAAAFIAQLTGTACNVMGLPVYEVNLLLQGAGYEGFLFR